MSIDRLPSLKPGIATHAVEDHEGRPLVLLQDLEHLTNENLALPLPLASFLVEHLDGEHDRETTGTAWLRFTGGDVPVTKLDAILAELDRRGLLQTAERERLRGAQREAYRAHGRRVPLVAATCYPEDPTAFSDALGPWIERAPLPPTNPRAVLMPHVDPRGAQAAYAAASRALAATAAETFVILGTSHEWLSRPFALTTLDYETPWGRLPVDRERVERLTQRAGGSLLDDEVAHGRESTVELPAVWLHAVVAERPGARIVPVLVGSVEHHVRGGTSPLEDPAFVDFAAALGEVVREADGRCALVAGVDFAHVGPQYEDGAEARTRSGIEDVLAFDRRLLEHAARLDAAAFFGDVQAAGNATQVCSTAPITLLLAALAGTGLQGALLAHDAYEIVPGSFVSFATMAFGRVGCPA